jgi:hypothetical protein
VRANRIKLRLWHAVGMFIGGWLAPLAFGHRFCLAATGRSCWRWVLLWIMAQPARCRAASVRKKTSMQTNLLNTKPADGLAAEAILQNVHCGFCTATCPTYQLPTSWTVRGRIYLIKQVLEEQLTRKTQMHLTAA